MKTVRIDFGPASGRQRRHLAWLLLATAVAACIWQLIQMHPVWQQRLQLREDWQRAVALRDAAAQPPQDDDSAAPLRQALAKAEGRLSTPWSQLFAGLESAAGPHVVLLGLEPDATTREVRIQAQARDMPALLVYVGRLADVPGLGSVRLESHQVQAQHPQRPVDGAIVARWQAAP